MRWLIAFCCIIRFGWVSAQDSSRGISITPSQKQATGTTRALIVGISAYQNLPSLQYADKDAEEFAKFLISNQSWQVDSVNIKFLSNENAKAGDIISWLMWLLENSEPGDNIVFYFSGHGDVETTKDVNKGYLLAHDAPKNNYVAGGAIAVDLLRTIYTEMIDRGIRLYMITDACRAGHLAGGSAGSRITAESFSKQWRNEIKILSAQPDELSYEGSQWGGGRGVFSFFLTKGLSGYADVNKDSSITLAEIEQYVGLQVSQETGFKQQPVFEGASKFSNKIARIDAASMNRYSQFRSGNIAVAVITEKGEPGIATGNCDGPYQSFRKSLNDMNDSSGIAQAMDEYSRLSSCDSGSLQSTARFMFTASLMNYVQEIVNQTLLGQKLIGPEKLSEGLAVIERIYQVNHGKRLVNRAHLENIRRYFLIHKASFWDDAPITEARQAELVSMLDSALADEPGAAYLELTKGILLMNAQEHDSAYHYFKKAIDHSPTWLMAYYFAGQALGHGNKIKEAVAYLEQALALDSTYQHFECAKCFYNMLGNMYAVLNENKKAEQYLLKAAEDKEFPDPVTSLISLYHRQKKYGQRDQLLERLRSEIKTVNDQLFLFEIESELRLVKKSAGDHLLDSLEGVATAEDMPLLYYVRGLWLESHNIDPVDDFRMAYESSPGEFTYADTFLEALVSRNEFEEAEEVITAISGRYSKSDQLKLDYYLAICYAFTDREKESLQIFKRFISQGYMDCRELKQLKPLKKRPEYKELIKSCR